MVDEERFQTQCDQCGQSDDHPKWSDGTVQKHHDCMSISERNFVSSTSPRAAEIIAACIDGLRGDELRAFIQAPSPEEVLQ